MRVGSAGIALSIAVSLAAVGIVAPPVGGATGIPKWCDERSWIGGTTEWCAGKLVYRDYVYDDDGADTQPLRSPHGTPLSRASGDVDHREHGQALNSADLITMKLWRDGDLLRAWFKLNTLFPKDRTIAALAIDIDNDRSTGGGRWSPKIGVSSSGWDKTFVFTHRDARTNVISGAVRLPISTSNTWRIQAATALGDGTPMNVAFRPNESGNWWEDEQSAALADGEVSSFGYRMNVADLVAGNINRPAPLPEPGLRERIYTSRYPIREGVDYDGLQIKNVRGTYDYLGPHQPYAIYVPEPDKTHTYGIQFALHGMSAAHASLVSSPGMQYAFGDLLRKLHDRPRLIVVPLGRGPNGWYVDYSERDVLDVLRDVKAHYPVDADRIFAGGYSMGGGGTYWLSSLYPDLFAGAIDWVGYTGDCLNGTPIAQGRQRPEPPVPGLWGDEPGSGCDGEGNVFDYLEGTRHVPMAMLYAGADELVWANHAFALRQRYADLGYEHVWWFHPAAEHLTFAILDNWEKEARWSANRTRVHNPARVTYRTNPYIWFTKAGLRQDSAYWVRDLLPAKPSRDRLGDMNIDLVSHRCAQATEPHTKLVDAFGENPVPWISQQAVPDESTRFERGDLITGMVSNVRSFTIDVKGACMTGRLIKLQIAVDGPTVVHFSDGRPEEVLRP